MPALPFRDETYHLHRYIDIPAWEALWEMGGFTAKRKELKTLEKKTDKKSKERAKVLRDEIEKLQKLLEPEQTGEMVYIQRKANGELLANRYSVVVVTKSKEDADKYSNYALFPWKGFNARSLNLLDNDFHDLTRNFITEEEKKAWHNIFDDSGDQVYMNAKRAITMKKPKPAAVKKQPGK